MPQHDSEYFAMPLGEMLEQSAPRMLAWTARWKMGIHQIICQAKLLSKKMTVPIGKIWDNEQTEEHYRK